MYNNNSGPLIHFLRPICTYPYQIKLNFCSKADSARAYHFCLLLPDVERDGDDCVEDDGVGEEDEQRDDGGAAQRVVGNLLRPRQVDLKQTQSGESSLGHYPTKCLKSWYPAPVTESGSCTPTSWACTYIPGHQKALDPERDNHHGRVRVRVCIAVNFILYA